MYVETARTLPGWGYGIYVWVYIHIDVVCMHTGVATVHSYAYTCHILSTVPTGAHEHSVNESR